MGHGTAAGCGAASAMAIKTGGFLWAWVSDGQTGSGTVSEDDAGQGAGRRGGGQEG